MRPPAPRLLPVRSVPALTAGGLLLLAVALPAAARAQSDADRATARALGQEAQRAQKAEEHTRAEDLFGRAYALFKAPTLGLGLARAQAALGKLVAAHETYNRVLREPPPPPSSPAFARALEEARRELEALHPRVPSVVITVTGPDDAAVTLDGAAVPRATLGVPRYVDPGRHTVAATAPGYERAEQTFTVAERESRPIALAPARRSDSGPAVAAGSPVAPPPALPAPAPLAAAGPARAPTTAQGAQGAEGEIDARAPGPSGAAAASTAAWTAGSAAAGMSLGALAMGVVSLVELQGLPRGDAPDDPRREAHTRTKRLVIGHLAAAGALAAGAGALLVPRAGDEPAAPRRSVGFGLLGLGVAGLGSGLASAVVARQVQDGLDEVCPGGACPRAQEPNVENQERLTTWARGALVGGGVALVAGTALVLTAPRSAAAPSAAAARGPRLGLMPLLAPGGAGVLVTLR